MAESCNENDHRCPPGETKCYCGMYETAPAPARMSEEEFERLAGWLHGPKDEYGPDWAIAEKFLAEARRAREEIAALRERASRLERDGSEFARAADEWKARADAAEADRERLRGAIEKAPHEDRCLSLRGTGAFGSTVTGRPCNCWKAEALGEEPAAGRGRGKP